MFYYFQFLLPLSFIIFFIFYYPHFWLLSFIILIFYYPDLLSSLSFDIIIIILDYYPISTLNSSLFHFILIILILLHINLIFIILIIILSNLNKIWWASNPGHFLENPGALRSRDFLIAGPNKAILTKQNLIIV